MYKYSILHAIILVVRQSAPLAAAVLGLLIFSFFSIPIAGLVNASLRLMPTLSADGSFVKDIPYVLNRFIELITSDRW
jgi:hypothetical protein